MGREMISLEKSGCSQPEASVLSLEYQAAHNLYIQQPLNTAAVPGGCVLITKSPCQPCPWITENYSFDFFFNSTIQKSLTNKNRIGAGLQFVNICTLRCCLQQFSKGHLSQSFRDQNNLNSLNNCMNSYTKSKAISIRVRDSLKQNKIF